MTRQRYQATRNPDTSRHHSTRRTQATITHSKTPGARMPLKNLPTRAPSNAQRATANGVDHYVFDTGTSAVTAVVGTDFDATFVDPTDPLPTALTGVLVVFGNLLADVLQGVMDPRVRQ